jgi:hypothetical protein
MAVILGKAGYAEPELIEWKRICNAVLAFVENTAP